MLNTIIFIYLYFCLLILAGSSDLRQNRAIKFPLVYCGKLKIISCQYINDSPLTSFPGNPDWLCLLTIDITTIDPIICIYCIINIDCAKSSHLITLGFCKFKLCQTVYTMPQRRGTSILGLQAKC